MRGQTADGRDIADYRPEGGEAPGEPPVGAAIDAHLVAVADFDRASRKHRRAHARLDHRRHGAGRQDTRDRAARRHDVQASVGPEVAAVGAVAVGTLVPAAHAWHLGRDDPADGGRWDEGGKRFNKKLNCFLQSNKQL